MQAWNQVKVKDETSAHANRAGVVTKVAEGVVTVALDADEERPNTTADFAADQLQFLG